MANSALPTCHSRGSSATVAACNSTRSVPPYRWRSAQFRAPAIAAENNTVRASRLVATCHGDTIGLVISRGQIECDGHRIQSDRLEEHKPESSNQITRDPVVFLKKKTDQRTLNNLTRWPSLLLCN